MADLGHMLDLVIEQLEKKTLEKDAPTFFAFFLEKYRIARQEFESSGSVSVNLIGAARAYYENSAGRLDSKLLDDMYTVEEILNAE